MRSPGNKDLNLWKRCFVRVCVCTAPRITDIMVSTTQSHYGGSAILLKEKTCFKSNK